MVFSFDCVRNDLLGPRTGEGIYPGEYVEIVQILESSNNTYLKLAEDRGWVFTTHPVHLTELFVQFTGYHYEEVNLEYRVDPSVVFYFSVIPSFFMLRTKEFLFSLVLETIPHKLVHF